jgi:hypothetical protein
MKWRNVLAIVLLFLGSFQMMGHLLGSRILRGLGAAGVFAPFPKVFCEADGYEAFAAKFYLEGVDEHGRPWSRELTPEIYSKLSGCYNRRNVYGATLAGAPLLPEALRNTLLARALADDSAMRRELQIPQGLREPGVRIVPRPGELNESWVYHAHAEVLP